MFNLARFFLILCVLSSPLAAAPADGILAQALALDVSSKATADFAKKTLHPLSLRHLQIRNALDEFKMHAGRVVEIAALANVDPGVFRKAMANLRTWGGTVDWHLANGEMSPAIRHVSVEWSRTVLVWKRLIGVVPPLAED